MERATARFGTLDVEPEKVLKFPPVADAPEGMEELLGKAVPGKIRETADSSQEG